MSKEQSKKERLIADIKLYSKKTLAWLKKARETVYRFHYLVGARVIRLYRQKRRKASVTLEPLRRRMRLWWHRQVLRRARRVARVFKEIFSAVPAVWRELAQVAKEKPLSVFACLWKIGKRGVQNHRTALGKVWRVAGPIAALAVLTVTVSAWTGTEFCLSLTYRGEQLGYIDSATVYNAAADMATDRVVNVDNSFSIDAAPKLTVAVKGDRNVLDDSQLCDAILRTAGDSIAEAIGVYVDGKFVGSMESKSELNSVFNSLKDGYYDKNDSSQRAEFIQNVKTVEGLFPSVSVTDKKTLKSKLTAEAVVKKTYTVQPGDTLSTIAVRNDMTTSQLRKMNPAYADTDMVHIGDELIIQKPQALLQVKVIKTIKYTETIDYKTTYVNNPNKLITWSTVKTNGQEGSQDIVAEVTYVDGEESGRQIVSRTVTKQPVTKVVERGTQPVYVNGSQVVQGDGVSKGQMSWPVPICRNMSRGWRYGHYALDICNGPVTVRNKPACAADGGKVVYAGWNGAYGYYVRIQHANGLSTAYAHLNAIKVVKGQTVSRNQVIGLIGSTGRSSGPHLHFEVLRNGARVNPLYYVTPGKIYY